MLFRHLVKENGIEIEKENEDFICDLIVGNKKDYEDTESNTCIFHCIEAWMFDIINNKRNSIDVDKFDYIKRDTQMMNLSYGSFDHQILLKDARVIENQIVYPLKHAYEV